MALLRLATCFKNKTYVQDYAKPVVGRLIYGLQEKKSESFQ